MSCGDLVPSTQVEKAKACSRTNRYSLGNEIQVSGQNSNSNGTHKVKDQAKQILTNSPSREMVLKFQ
ncbi:hypothetical protein ERO13_D08G232650v2 [Gossypium hirsutum]|nr:hypothetical protein ERO13_D08G232650v2 [Gossypium hirsutum]